jgi:MFS family permease
VIERQKLGRFQIVLGALLVLCMFVDGFEAQAPGFAGPALIEALGFPRASLGLVFGAGNLGLMMGAVCLGILGDRAGTQAHYHRRLHRSGGFQLRHHVCHRSRDAQAVAHRVGHRRGRRAAFGDCSWYGVFAQARAGGDDLGAAHRLSGGAASGALVSGF